LTIDVGCDGCVVTEVEVDQQVNENPATQCNKPDREQMHTANMSDSEASVDERMSFIHFTLSLKHC